MTVSEEEFADWRQHPVTEWVLGLMRFHAGEQKAKWADLAWQDGVIDPLALSEARTRADCYLAIPDSSYNDWVEIDASRD